MLRSVPAERTVSGECRSVWNMNQLNAWMKNQIYLIDIYVSNFEIFLKVSSRCVKVIFRNQNVRPELLSVISLTEIFHSHSMRDDT